MRRKRRELWQAWQSIGENVRIISANDERPAAPRTKAHAGRFFGRRHDVAA